MKYLIIVIALVFSSNIYSKPVKGEKNYDKRIAKYRAAQHPQGSGLYPHRYGTSYPGRNRYSKRFRVNYKKR